MTTKKSDLTFWDHLHIFRKYLLIYFFSLIGGVVSIHQYHKQIIDLIYQPLGDITTVFLSPLDPFIFVFKIDIFGSFLLTLPIGIISIFLFVAPAIPTPKKWTYFLWFFVSAFMLMCGAVVYTFMLLIPLSLNFLLSIELPGIQNGFTAQNYLNFVITLLAMSISISFIPLITIFATIIHIFNPYDIGGKRGLIYIGLTFILAFLSPTTDLYTLLILLIPAVSIFEISIIIAKIIYSHKVKKI